MSDITERLRGTAAYFKVCGDPNMAALLRGAADEIEALREKLDDARQIADDWERMWNDQ